MEIFGIDKVQSLTKIAKKEAIQPTRMEDTLTISGEAQKKAEWVDMLKAMPDVRLDKIESAMRSDAYLQPTKVFAEVAHLLINDPN